MDGKRYIEKKKKKEEREVNFLFDCFCNIHILLDSHLGILLLNIYEILMEMKKKYKKSMGEK